MWRCTIVNTLQSLSQRSSRCLLQPTKVLLRGHEEVGQNFHLYHYILHRNPLHHKGLSQCQSQCQYLTKFGIHKLKLGRNYHLQTLTQRSTRNLVAKIQCSVFANLLYHICTCNELKILLSERMLYYLLHFELFRIFNYRCSCFVIILLLIYLHQHQFTFPLVYLFRGISYLIIGCQSVHALWSKTRLIHILFAKVGTA